ncbi:MAG: 30S ribosomal protein S4 [Pseudomonadota bacterium]
MAKDTGPKCRYCRREGAKLFLKAARCFTDKCAFERRPYPPGQHGQGRVKPSDFSIRLREKQKVKRLYGLGEGQMRRYFKMAGKMGKTGESLLQLFERRLDNVVLRMGLAKTRMDARQLVLHRHVRVNSRTVNIPSFLVKANDVVSVREKSKSIKRIAEAVEFSKNTEPTPWLEVNREKMEAVIKSLPDRASIQYAIKEQLIVEFYSR